MKESQGLLHGRLLDSLIVVRMTCRIVHRQIIKVCWLVQFDTCLYLFCLVPTSETKHYRDAMRSCHSHQVCHRSDLLSPASVSTPEGPTSTATPGLVAHTTCGCATYSQGGFCWTLLKHAA
jgi:hypothetical protein